MGPLLELLATPDTSLVNDFGESVTLTHRAYWFTLNPFGDVRMQGGDGALFTHSALGKVINGSFRALPSSTVSAIHTVAETRAIILAGGNLLANVVAAHKVKAGIA
jgi:hypothetical protein